MKTILFLTLLTATLSNACTTTQTGQNADISSMKAQLARLEQNDAAQRAYIAKLEAARTTAPAAPAPAPAVAMSAPAPVAAAPGGPVPIPALPTLVRPDAAAYECYVGSKPAAGQGGHWGFIRNSTTHWLEMTLNDKQLVVKKQVGPRQWVRIAHSTKPYLTVMPPASVCWYWVPYRIDAQNQLIEFQLKASAYDPAMGSLPGRPILASHPDAVMNRPWTFTMENQGNTGVSLDWYQFN